jgi:RNA methyltransferase, TrmH family
MITSKTNERIKKIRLLKQAKHRDSREEYFIEGIRLVEEAFGESEFVREILHSPRLEGTPRGARLLSLARQIFPAAEWLYVDDEVLASLSDTQNHQGILAVLKKRDWRWEDVSQRKGPVFCFHELQDPRNLGAIFRALEAGGAAGMVLSSGSVDPYNPKVVRASMGSFFRIPFVICQSPIDILQDLRSRGYRIWAATVQGQKSFWEIESFDSAAVLLGQEGAGLPAEWEKQADGALRIPMAPPIDSLNVAMAAGLIAYEAFRRRQSSLAKNQDRKDVRPQERRRHHLE